MSNYFNEAGEPLMDGAAMRYEMYLDSTYEPEPDYFLNEGVYYEPEYIDPEDCEHGDLSYRGKWTVECDSGCESTGLVIVNVDVFAGQVGDDVIVWQ